MPWLNLGTRNKPTCWEYGSAYSFLHSKLPRTKFNIPLFFAYGQDEKNQHCHDVDSIDKDVRLMWQEFENGLYIDQFFNDMVQGYMKICQIFDNKLPDLPELGDNELADIYKNYTIAIAEPNMAMLISLYTMYFDDHYTEILYESLLEKEQANPEYILQIKAILLATSETSYAQLEEDALYDFIQPYLFKTVQPSLDSLKEFCQLPENKNKLLEIIKKYGWFHMEYHKEPANFEDYLQHLWETISQPGFNNEAPYKIREAIKGKQDKFFVSHPNTQQLKNLTHVLQRFAYILDHSKMIVIKGIHTARPIYKEMGRRLGLGEIDFRYLVMPEALNLLQKNQKADSQIIEDRKKYRAVFMKEGQISVYGGNEAKNLAEKLLTSKASTDISKIKGIIGYPGVITGRVTLVSSISDRAKFHKGDIMVTHDGSAELTIFLKEAGAIITDEGGMICHASIIAREMKTPCIVATKIATQVFKDGDLVEVDANKGIVKKAN